MTDMKYTLPQALAVAAATILLLFMLLGAGAAVSVKTYRVVEGWLW